MQSSVEIAHELFQLLASSLRVVVGRQRERDRHLLVVAGAPGSWLWCPSTPFCSPIEGKDHCNTKRRVRGPKHQPLRITMLSAARTTEQTSLLFTLLSLRPLDSPPTSSRTRNRSNGLETAGRFRAGRRTAYFRGSTHVGARRFDGARSMFVAATTVKVIPRPRIVFLENARGHRGDTAANSTRNRRSMYNVTTNREFPFLVHRMCPTSLSISSSAASVRWILEWITCHRC